MLAIGIEAANSVSITIILSKIKSIFLKTQKKDKK